MKIARKVPQIVKSPVYVTDDCYELWYGRPVSLGRINKRGDYWYTVDGMRFMSSRDALEYLIRITEGTPRQGTAPMAAPLEIRPKPAAPKTPARAVEKPVLGPPAPERPRPTAVEYNQNHPLFQQFLEFMDFAARRKIRPTVDRHLP